MLEDDFLKAFNTLYKNAIAKSVEQQLKEQLPKLLKKEVKRQLLNITDTCTFLGVSRSTFLKMRKMGNAPKAVFIGDGVQRYDVDDLKEWVKKIKEPC